jgi:two-component system alkaline phosphatase synthesis response regulator PhoP
MSEPNKRILVVDDETHILHVVRLKLSNAGFEVITAEDGEQGLDMALAHRPDLVITDLHMPFMTGLELCQALKQHEATGDIPALMLTAHGFSVPAEALARTNVVSVISKPFSPREILEQVQRLLAENTEVPAAP